MLMALAICTKAVFFSGDERSHRTPITNQQPISLYRNKCPKPSNERGRLAVRIAKQETL